MAAIALRSPQYKSLTAGAASVYALCTIKIGGVLKYTLRKEAAPSQVVVFEIAELCRDFLDAGFDGDYSPATPVQTLTIETEINSYDSSTPPSITASTQAINDIGYDAYGTFMEGANPTVVPSVPTWLISKNPNNTGINDIFYIYVPYNVSGYVPYINTNKTLGYQSYGSADLDIVGSPAGVRMNIVRIDCTKYGEGHKITFVNKFGALQDLWFFLKSVNTTTKKQDQFQRNIINGTTYNVNQHTKQVFNTIANTSITLSSGYYPEWANQFFEQLLLSEKVWLTRPVSTNPSNEEVVPVNVKKSNMVKKTVLNNKLIEYTFEFDMSFDYINNIR